MSIDLSNIIAEIRLCLEENERVLSGGADDDRLYSVPYILEGEGNASSFDREILSKILQFSSPMFLDEIYKLFPVGTKERAFLDEKIRMYRKEKDIEFRNAFDSDELMDSVGDTLDYALSNQSFYELLLVFIEQAGYRKVSDFYNQIGIDHRYWHRYKMGFIPPKKRLIEIIFYLKLKYEDSEYLMNIAGYAFSRNNTTDVIIMYFLRKQFVSHMSSEEALILLDQVLINFNQAPIHSDES